jgi:hypothetical protein
MVEGTPYIELRICLEQPAELFMLVSAFTALGNQFDQYIKREHPNLHGAANLFVKEIRKGSIIVELIPIIQPLIQNMDVILIVDTFVTRYGGVLRRYIEGQSEGNATKSDLKDLMGQVAVIANDPNGRSSIASIIYDETKATKRVEVTFDTKGAKKARDMIERQRIAMDLPAYEVSEKVFMIFYQSNVKTPKPGKKTGEKVIIERIHKKPLAIVYETEMARERIKFETREDDKNLYKKGFFVDCYVEKSNGRPVAYRVSAVHDVIDLPDPD